MYLYNILSHVVTRSLSPLQLLVLLGQNTVDGLTLCPMFVHIVNTMTCGGHFKEERVKLGIERGKWEGRRKACGKGKERDKRREAGKER